MDAWGYIVLIVGALVIGVAAHYVMTVRLGYESVITALGAGAAAFVFSEFELFGLGKWGTEYLGIAIFPALIAALVAAVLVEGVLYYVERPTTS